MARRYTDGPKKKFGPAARPARKPARKLAVLTLTIPDSLSDRVGNFLGAEIINDPTFWMVALQTGVEELERQFREIEADTKQDAEITGGFVIFGSPVIINPSADDDPDDDPDGIPF